MTKISRSLAAARAINEAEKWLLDWQERHAMTAAEVVSFHAKSLSCLASQAMREEREEREDDFPEEPAE